MPDRNLYALSCAGGGAHGAFQVGVLKYIHENFCNGDHSPFQIFTGSSCGALNTSFYASQSYDARVSRDYLEELWLGFHVPSYHGNIFKAAGRQMYRHMRRGNDRTGMTYSLLDPQPMYEVVQKGFLRKNFEKAMLMETTLGAGMATTELISGRCCWFVEGARAMPWNLFHSIGKIDRVSPTHLSASCSVPIFLPPVRIGERYFSDGSVSLSRPLSAAIHMGATHILRIATEKPYPDELPKYSPNFKPRMSNMIRMIINTLTHDSASDEAIQLDVLNQFYEAMSKRGLKDDGDTPPLPLFHEEALPAHYRPARILMIHPTRRMKQTSVDADYGQGDRSERHATRFMFHEKFIRELIRHGYEDARAQHVELKSFFDPPSEKRGFFSFLKRV